MRQSWRVSSTVEVLPLVPVTATQTSGKGAKKRAASRANRRRGFGVRDMHRALDLRLRAAPRPRRARRDGLRDEILAIDPRSLERAEDASLRHLAVVDRKAGHGQIRHISRQSCGEHIKAHHSSPVSWDRSGISSDMSTSRR
jgi:hypothetical protein